MIRKVHNLTQGSPEWHAFRAKHFTASEAAAMMGASPYTTRDQLLRQKKTGIAPEVSEATQRVFDNGHRVEALARPFIEAEIGQDLYPAIYSYDFLSASCDGITIDGSTAWEHKQFNADLFASVQAGMLPEHHKPQCQQVLLVTGAESLIFTVSDGTAEKIASMTVYPDEAYQQRLIAGWNQFAVDLAAYEVQDMKPEPVKAVVESLPAVFVQVQGSLTCQDNIGKFAEQLAAFLERVPANPETDDDFAVCEAAVKTLSNAEDALKTAKDNSLGYVKSLADLHRLIDAQAEIARTNRLRLDKLVKAEKENRRIAIVNAAQMDFRDFVSTGFAYTDYLPAINPDFAGAIKGLKTLASIQNAVNTALANAKIEATQAHNRVAANYEAIVSGNDQYAFLFRDLRDLVLRDADYVALTVKTRIAEHKEAEAKRINAERERIRIEEQARAEAEVIAKQQTEQQAPSADAAPAIAVVENPAPNVTAIKQQAANDDGATMTLGQINAKLAPIQLSADGLRSLGFEFVGTAKAAKLYREIDLTRICDALVAHIRAIGLPKAD